MDLPVKINNAVKQLIIETVIRLMVIS